MKCKCCGEELSNFKFFSLEFLSEGSEENYFSHFCSKECSENFVNKKNIEKFKLYKISRCGGYEYCLKLGNLRNMCEEEKLIKDNISKKRDGLFFNSQLNHSSLIKWCEPAQISIITSSVKLLEYLEEFDKKSSELSNKTLDLNENMYEISKDTLKHTKAMNILTIVILIATIINLILFILTK
ncbi:MAG: hypothetical protein LBU40_02255 [Methanobrevibacter sp.]|nr:hypothetical protein [Methanobrevibacter sp.]